MLLRLVIQFTGHASLTLSDIMRQLFYTQVLCIFLVIFGIVIEFIYEANVGFLSITIGSLLFALTTKIENYYLTKRKD